jgi:hypothetical protein
MLENCSPESSLALPFRLDGIDRENYPKHTSSKEKRLKRSGQGKSWIASQKGNTALRQCGTSHANEIVERNVSKVLLPETGTLPQPVGELMSHVKFA